MKAVVIINRKAGAVLWFRGRGGLRERFRTLFREAGVDADVFLVRGGEICARARAAARSGVDTVVAGGGDGTISAVASELVGTDVPLGVLPIGTLNHFAKDLGIPTDPAGAVRVIAAGVTRTVDVGEVNGRTFVNNSSVGLYTHIVQRRNQQMAQIGRRKWLAMIVASLAVFRRFPLMRVRLEADGEIVRGRTPFVFVGNNQYEFDVFALGRRSGMADGQLSVYAPHSRSVTGLAWLAARALVGRLDGAKDIDMLMASEFWLETRRRRIRVSVDGEIIRLVPPLHYRARPGALRVFAPAPEDQ